MRELNIAQGFSTGDNSLDERGRRHTGPLYKDTVPRFHDLNGIIDIIPGTHKKAPLFGSSTEDHRSSSRFHKEASLFSESSQNALPHPFAQSSSSISPSLMSSWNKYILVVSHFRHEVLSKSHGRITGYAHRIKEGDCVA